MNCQRARDSFPELLDARTPAASDRSHPAATGPQSPALEEARAHLAGCPECQRDFSQLAATLAALDSAPLPPPPARLRENFRAMLEQEKNAAAGLRTAASRPGRSSSHARRWAWLVSPLFGCALVALGFFLGQRSTAPAADTPPSVASDDATRRELAALREQLDAQRRQLDKMTTLVGYSILQQQSNPANERLQGILAHAADAAPSERDIDLLIKALNLDPSANVRLRALEALYRHVDREMVRAGVLAALPREQNPLVQLELIDFVAAAQEHDAAPYLERMSVDASIDRTVRDAAQLALARL